MNELDDLKSALAKIHMTLKTDLTGIEEIMNEVLDIGKSFGLNPEKRVEGYALTPSHQAAVIGLPHLRVAQINDLIMVWIRAPYALDEERCKLLGLDAEQLYQKLLYAAREIAEILKKYSKESEFLQISLP